MNKISIVTAFFDIGRGGWTPDKGLPHYLQRSTDTYIQRFSHLLDLNTDVVVFTSFDLVEKLEILGCNRNARLTVVGVNLEEYSQIKTRISNIQNNETFRSSINPSECKNPEYWNPDYVLVTNLKAHFTNLAISNNLTKNDMVAWIDFGYCRDNSKIPQSNSWEYNFDKDKIHLFSYKQYDLKPILNIVADNDVYILGAKVVAHKTLWSKMEELMFNSFELLAEQNFVDDDQGLWLISYLLEQELFELHMIPDHRFGYDPFVLFNQFNDTV